MWLYGRNVIREILKNGRRKVHGIYALKTIKDAEDIINEAKLKGIKVVFEEKRALEEMTGTDKNQGIAANVQDVESFDIDEWLRKVDGMPKVTVAVLDQVEDPHNLGAIIRSCEIFGICGIILSSNRAAPLNDAAYKASSGAAEYVDIIQVVNIKNALLKLKEKGFWVYGFDLAADKYLDEIQFDKYSALVFGNEGDGMRRLVKENCDFLVKIRQVGKIDSLNVSNAAAVAFHEVLRNNIQK